MRNKTIIHFIYCFAFFMYVDAACFGCYMIHSKQGNAKKQMREEVEEIFNYPDLTLYANK